MGGIINTTKKAMATNIASTKNLLTGKGRWDDVANVYTGSVSKQVQDSMKKGGEGSPPDPGSFEFDAEKSAADRAAIEAEGKRQYDENLKAIDEFGTGANQRAKDLFGQMLPDIAENAQAAHLYDSTGYGQEVARQQSGIASQIAEQEAQQKLAALAGRQGFQTGGVQRVMSLEDFADQARVAKILGAQMAPSAPSSKATGTSGALAGAGTGATVGTSILPGWGTAIGAALGGAAGYMGGSQANKKGGK